MPYVCNCTGIGSQAFARHVEAGARTPAEVYAAHGATPGCGRCAVGMRQLIAVFKETGCAKAMLERLAEGVAFASPPSCAPASAAVLRARVAEREAAAAPVQGEAPKPAAPRFHRIHRGGAPTP